MKTTPKCMTKAPSCGYCKLCRTIGKKAQISGWSEGIILGAQSSSESYHQGDKRLVFESPVH
jgi:hypothetical protein